MDERIFLKYDEQIMERYQMDLIGSMATVFVEKWGMVVGYRRPDDQAAQVRTMDLLPVEAVIDRAFDMARKLTARLKDEGCLRDLGPLADRRFTQASYDA